MRGDDKEGFNVAVARAALEARRARQVQERERERQALVRILRAAVGSILPRFPGVRRAYLFGSALRHGALRVPSDVDIALEGTLDAEGYFALWRELERVIGRPVDLVELEDDVPFAARVRERGELLYERRDPDPESRHFG